MILQNLIWERAVVNVTISDGRIAAIEVIRPADESDLANLYWLLPGGVDLHVHGREPDEDETGEPRPSVLKKEDWEHLCRAAILGGITTVVLMPNPTPPIISVKAVRHARTYVPANSPIKPYYWIGATPNNLAEIEAARAECDVVGVKSYLGSTFGPLLLEHYEDQLAVARLCARLNWPNAVHCEDEALMKSLLAKLDREPQLCDHPDIRSEEVEVKAVEQALRVGHDSGCWMHFCHVSTVTAAEMIFAARAGGQRVSAETCPHYWRFNRDCLQLSDAGRYKMNPPLRAEATRHGIWERLVNGSFDTIGSDHAPHRAEEKNQTRYQSCPSGIPGIQTLMPLTIDLVLGEQMSVADAIHCTSTWPSKIIGLERGVIKAGAVADLVLVDPRQQTEITNASMAYKCGWTPYDGITTQGKIVATMIGGRLYHDIRQN